jgi:hypothetical protein
LPLKRNHPDKTFIGKMSNGYEFLGYSFKPGEKLQVGRIDRIGRIIRLILSLSFILPILPRSDPVYPVNLCGNFPVPVNKSTIMSGFQPYDYRMIIVKKVYA